MSDKNATLPHSSHAGPEPGDPSAPPGIAACQRGSSAGPEPGDPSGSPDAPTWHSRGYIPHFESAEAVQHVTYHLADSLPAGVLARLEDELRSVHREQRDTERRKRIEAWLDAGHGCCVLREPEVAATVQASFLHFDGERYRLLAWVVMPNHVHVLFQPLPGWTMAKIVTSWKTFTGRKIAEYLDRTGTRGQAGAWRSQDQRQVWQREYWDRFIRDERHFWTAVAYIHDNPVKAGLIESAEEWAWSSARLEPGVPSTSPGIAACQRGPLAGPEPGGPSTPPEIAACQRGPLAGPEPSGPSTPPGIAACQRGFLVGPDLRSEAFAVPGVPRREDDRKEVRS